jgi:hypothetical protein
MLYRKIIAVCSQIHTEHITIQYVPHSKHSVSVINISQLMLYREIIAVCSQIHTKHINTQSVPRTKYTPSRFKKTSQLMLYRETIAIKTSQLVLYREIIAVCSQIHTKHTNTQSVPRSKHSVSFINPVSYRELYSAIVELWRTYAVRNTW